MRAAISQWNAKALSGANRDVSAEFAGRHKQRERQRIGNDNRQRVRRMQPLYDVTMVTNTTGMSPGIGESRRIRPPDRDR